MKNTKLDYISSSLLILNGLICCIGGDRLLPLLPIVCGIILLTKGFIQFIKGIINKDYKSLEKTNFEKSFILIAVGIGVLIKRSDALFIVGLFWGLYGLMKFSNYLNIALYNFYNKGKWVRVLIKAIVEFILSIILIFDPFGKLGHHIVILGLELIFEGSIDLINLYKKNKINKLELDTNNI